MYKLLPLSERAASLTDGLPELGDGAAARSERLRDGLSARKERSRWPRYDAPAGQLTLPQEKVGARAHEPPAQVPAQKSDRSSSGSGLKGGDVVADLHVDLLGEPCEQTCRKQDDCASLVREGEDQLESPVKGDSIITVSTRAEVIVQLPRHSSAGDVDDTDARTASPPRYDGNVDSGQRTSHQRIVDSATAGGVTTSSIRRGKRSSVLGKVTEAGDAQSLMVRVVWGLMALVAINFFIIFGARPTFRNPETGRIQTWEPYVVLNAIIASIVLLALGLPADLLLLGISSAFCTLRIITCDELLGGLSNEGVVAVAALCAVSAAIDKTKALDSLMGKALGNPSTTSMGIIRMAIPLISLGSVFNNTPLVAVFIPIVKDWTARAGLDVGHFMMPLSFFAMLSATLTTMGSSTNLLAVKLVPEANISFLDPAPVGVVIIITGVLYCMLLAPCMLPCATASPNHRTDSDTKVKCAKDFESNMSRDRFTVHLKLAHDGPLVGHPAKDAGLLNALQEPAKVRCTVGDGSKELEVGERLEVSNATAEEIMSMAAVPGFRLQAFSSWYVRETSSTSLGASLWKKAKKVQLAMRFRNKSNCEEQSAGLRSLTTDFESGIEEASRLTMPVRRWVAAGMGGGWADARHILCKLVVPPGGPLGIERDSVAGDLDQCIVRFLALEEYLSGLDCTLVSLCGVVPDQDSCVTFRGGELLLVETSSAAITKELQRNFALVMSVEEQPPPARIILSPLDKFRPFLAVCSLLSTVVAAALDLAPLDAVAILVALSSILLGTLNGRDLYRSINGPVLLTVAASFGAGAAIYNTGLATCLASGVLFVAEDAGHAAIMAALVGLALTLA
eukprot:TRINITY_DN11276_c0_g2_i2.p1 TRINITY_DN11276_c0_g2~~TRINITY_DN11276_c0_g2_i2.p1  ORF type:complete len:848 (-),score=96.31 TRINITY_DN11276_c0_g2_i2:102-2645(-)